MFIALPIALPIVLPLELPVEWLTLNCVLDCLLNCLLIDPSHLYALWTPLRRLCHVLWTPFGRHCTSFGRPWEAFWTPGRPCGPRTVKKDSALICAMTRRLPELQTNFFRELILTPVARVSMTLSLFWRSVFWHFFSYPICTLFLVSDSIWETILHALWSVREPWKSSQNVDGRMIFTLWTSFFQGWFLG